MPFCHECGSRLEASHRFCPECGAARPDIEQDGSTESRSVAPQVETGVDEREPNNDHEGLVGFAIAFPGRRGVGQPIIGGVLLLLFFLVVPIFILLGYFVHLARAAARGEPPPRFEEWGSMLTDGVVLFVVFIPIVIGYSLVLAGLDAVHGALAFLWSVLALYTAPAIFANFAAEGDWQAAFDVGTIATLIGNGTYLIGFVIYVIVFGWVGSIVVAILMVLSLLTILGWIIIWPILFFYWFSTVAALWGRVYRDVFGATAASERSTPSPGGELPRSQRRDPPNSY